MVIFKDPRINLKSTFLINWLILYSAEVIIHLIWIIYIDTYITVN